ncbi:hypothetical protein RHSIM_RhsimUnG0257400 [Rhododendron simsii]|uniref:Rx N-terminal domain-containing protein n=1 Tax=Rhododendron simsii TaxID=118357 RepID=A0A834FTB2_RHOSS|nr:hypothetical protein RHSIM_RhsimUnG0257400 [Rhododendron simsii]
MAETIASLVMENLEELMSCKRDLIREEEDQIAWLYKSLQFLIAFLKDLRIKFKDHEGAKNLEAQIRDVVYEAEIAVDLFIVNTVLKEEEEAEENMIAKLIKKIGILGKTGHNCSLNLGHLKKEIEAIRTEAKEMYDKRTYNVQTVNNRIIGTLVISSSSCSSSSKSIIPLMCIDSTPARKYTRSLFPFHGPNYRFKLLRVLHSRFSLFPCVIELQLVLLKYLNLGVLLPLGSRLQNAKRCLPASISNLQNLETLIFSSFGHSGFYLPHSIRKMVKLRHVRVTGPGVNIDIESPDNLVDYPLFMGNLQTLSWINTRSWTDVLARSPNLRKLGLNVSECGYTDWRLSRLPNLEFLNHVQELKLSTPKFASSHYLGFPPNLIKLTLKGTRLSSGDMSKLTKLLPNLEALKLSCISLVGFFWETSGVFPKLKFLKLKSHEILRWVASSDDFPRLERLVLERCSRLKQIPSGIGDIPTLKTIELHGCNPSLASSAMKIKVEQESEGNNGLQIKITK